MREARSHPVRARDLWAASRGFTLVWVVHLGRRHGLLEALARASRPLSASALARRARVDPKASELWCAAGAAVGLLRLRGRAYSLPRNLVVPLVGADDPRYMGGHLSYLALRSLDFDAFDPFFRDGVASTRRQRHLADAFGEATRFDHSAFIDTVLARLPGLKRLLAEGCDVLDVGAGGGSWEFRVAPLFVKSSFLGLEIDRTALHVARAGAARRKLNPRVRFVQGDGETMRLAKRFDMVYLGEMLCAARDPGRVLERCHRALRPGGALVICEGLVDESAGPDAGDNAIVVPMQLEFALQPARFLGKRELHAQVKRAGFKRVRLVSAGGGLWFLIASRP